MPDAAPDTAPMDAGVQTIEAVSPPVEAAGDCEGMAGYEAHEAGEPALDWSALHADVRFFGDHTDPFQVDADLVAALGGESAEVGIVTGSTQAFRAYAEAAPKACHVSAWPLPDAHDRTDGTVQWLAPRPGFTLADETTHLLVDLRAAPEGPSLTRFLEELSEVLVSGEIILHPELRSFNGMRDEYWAPTFTGRENSYQSSINDSFIDYTGSASRDLVVGFIVGDHIAPSAARAAIAFRVANKGVILGQGFDVSVAERSAHPAGEGGMLFRSMMLRDEGGDPLPDRVEPDVPFTSQSADALAEAFAAVDVAGLGALQGDATREPFLRLPPETNIVATERHEGSRQAALITLHGAAQLFFPYWDVVPSDPNAHLDAALALELGEGENFVVYQFRSVRYFSHAFHDSHGFTYFAADPPSPTAPVGVVPFLLDTTPTGEPVVRLSNHPDFHPGDVITASRGVSAEDLMARQLALISSSASSAERNALGVFYSVQGTRDYELRAPDGSTRTVNVPVADLEGTERPVLPSRTFGTLEDLGHPEIFYINMDAGVVSGNWEALRAGIDAAESILLDSRSYPGPECWQVVRRLLNEGSPGVQMRQYYRTVLRTTMVRVPQQWGADPAGFDGDVVVMVAPTTQSQAEHLVLTLQAANRVTVVGRPTAGANGTITSIALPGSYAQTFTGMIVLQSDESTFHGLGVQVDEPVDIEPSLLAEGRDPEMVRALAILTAD